MVFIKFEYKDYRLKSREEFDSVVLVSFKEKLSVRVAVDLGRKG